MHISQVAYQFGGDFPHVLNLSKLKLGNKKMSVKRPYVFAFISFLIGFDNTIYLRKKISYYSRIKKIKRFIS
jgi:hypothetical protein